MSVSPRALAIVTTIMATNTLMYPSITLARPSAQDKKIAELEAHIKALEAKLEKVLDAKLNESPAAPVATVAATTQDNRHAATTASGTTKAAAPASTLSQTGHADTPVTRSELASLNQKVRLIERKMDVDKEENTSRWDKLPKNIELGSQGLKVVSQDQENSIYFRTLIQADSNIFMDDSNAVPTNANGSSIADKFFMRRVRPIIEGTVWKWFDYRVMPDFGMGTTRLFDAYIDMRYFRQASLTGGKFKSPISLERLQSASALPFVERAFPTQLAPNRDVGFMLHGEFDQPGYPSSFSPLNRNQTHNGNYPMYNYPDFLSYQVGIFDGSRNNGSIDSDTNDAKEYQGRLFSHPFLHSGISALEGLGLGVGGSWGRPNDDTLSTYQSPGLQNIFVYNSLARADGQQYRVYPQSYWIMGPFQLVGEYALSNQDIANQVTVDRLTQNKFSTNQNDQAWNVTASYVLTGETNTFLTQGIKPRHNFNPAEGNWGAFQVAARWSSINFDRNIFENVGTAEKPIYPFADPRVSVAAATTWGLGINWWLNPNVKLMTDYSQTSFQQGAGEFSSSGQLTPAILARETEKVWQTRMQLGF